jgi:hypothetical protein
LFVSTNTASTLPPRSATLIWPADVLIAEPEVDDLAGVDRVVSDLPRPERLVQHLRAVDRTVLDLFGPNRAVRELGVAHGAVGDPGRRHRAVRDVRVLHRAVLIFRDVTDLFLRSEAFTFPSLMSFDRIDSSTMSELLIVFAA